MQKQYSISQPQHLFTKLIAEPTALSLSDVLIFKTSIQTDSDKIRIKKVLDTHPLVAQWNIDLEDVDRVLRIVSKHLEHNDITALIAKAGYYSEELVW